MKTLKSNSLVQNICMFLQQVTSYCKDSSITFLATSFIRKITGSSDSMYPSIFMLENILCCNFTLCRPNSQGNVSFTSIVGSGNIKYTL